MGEGLSTIKYYRHKLRDEAYRKCGFLDYSSDELCDEWWRRRQRGDPEAMQIEHTRLKLKRFWHSLEHAAQWRIMDQERKKEEDEASSRSIRLLVWSTIRSASIFNLVSAGE